MRDATRNAWKCQAAMAALLCASACSTEVDLPGLGIHYAPPSGVKVTSENPGPPVVVQFSGGLEIRRGQGALPALDAEKLAPLLAVALEKTGLPALATPPVDARAGTCPLGPVARYETRGSNRKIFYVVPQGATFLVLVFTPDTSDGKADAAFERSLGTLRAL